ncbi:hypothetical protein E2C01_003368 [Portunus trituberculatus]|uniref:Uncharacterized protein n=1 Tax=Portunus trituberculatus TaxID=210409 RepID=A0A5B7CM69_PORTR|nr:hypothetical protein [Portunus trituberculatus]
MMINLHRTCWLFDGHGDTVTPAAWGPREARGGEGRGQQQQYRGKCASADSFLGGWLLRARLVNHFRKILGPGGEQGGIAPAASCTLTSPASPASPTSPPDGKTYSRSGHVSTQRPQIDDQYIHDHKTFLLRFLASPRVNLANKGVWIPRPACRYSVSPEAVAPPSSRVVWHRRSALAA